MCLFFLSLKRVSVKRSLVKRLVPIFVIQFLENVSKREEKKLDSKITFSRKSKEWTPENIFKKKNLLFGF